MPRLSGTPKAGGRKAGTPNKRTQELHEKLSELDCDPIKGMVDIANDSQADGNLMLAGQMYKELAQYVYPKRKAMALVTDHDDEMVTSVTIHRVDASKKEKQKKAGN